MSEFLTTKEVAALLRIKERKVYDLAARNAIPCAKATGKLLFPKTDIRNWMQAKGVVSDSTHLPKSVVLGSHDPVLEWALSASGSGLPTLFSGSYDGITRFNRREGVVCSIHIENQQSDGWNTEVVQQELKGSPCVLLHWAKRERGLLVKPGEKIHSFADIVGRRIVVRQAAAGSQQAFERRLQQAGISSGDLEIGRQAQTETEAALAILEGQADATFGLRCFADRYQLDFIPVCIESYDLIVDRHAYFEPEFQALLDFTHSGEFATEVRRYVGYDITDNGKILFNSPRA